MILDVIVIFHLFYNNVFPTAVANDNLKEDNKNDWIVLTNSFHDLTFPLKEEVGQGQDYTQTKNEKQDYNDYYKIKITDFYSDKHLFVIPSSRKYNNNIFEYNFNTLEEHKLYMELELTKNTNKMLSNYYQRHLKIKKYRNVVELEKDKFIFQFIENKYKIFKKSHQFRVYEFYNMRKQDVQLFLGRGEEEGNGIENKNIYSIEINHKISITSLSNSVNPCRTYSSSVNFGYGLDMIDSRTLALDNKYCPGISTQGQGSSVFILDTGFLTSSNPVPNDIDGSRVFRIFDDYYNGDYASDLNGHGTHVTSIVFSSIYGVAPKSTMYILKVLNDRGSGSFSNIINALLLIYVSPEYSNGIISMSLGAYLGDGVTSSPSPTIDSLIGLLMDEKNFIIVAAAGNDGKDACYHYPSRINGVISVGSSNVRKSVSSFSNYGPCVSTFAPGEQIIGLSLTSINDNNFNNTINGTEFVDLMIKEKTQNDHSTKNDINLGLQIKEIYANKIRSIFQHESTTFFIIERILSGTSQATPFVTGYFSLLKSVNINSSHSRLKNIFFQSLTNGQLSNFLTSSNSFLYVGSFTPSPSNINTPSPSSFQPAPPPPPNVPLPLNSSGKHLISRFFLLILLFLMLQFN